MIETASTTVSKKQAISIASDAWRVGVLEKERNVVSGFATCGLWPISFPKMLHRLKRYQDGGINKDENQKTPSWIKTREVVQTEVLEIPTRAPSNAPRRKTVDVQGRLMTRDQLNMMET
jgi:hypothetical protein